MTLLVGELRQIGIEITSNIGQDFIIESADYTIIKADGTIVENGAATIEDKKILTLFSANTGGNFFCEFTYRIASEILKAKVRILVRG